MTGAGDGVQPQLVGFAVGVFTLRNDADALTLDVLQLGIAAGQIEGDVLDPTDAAFLHQGVVLGDSAKKGRLGFVGVDRNVGVRLLFGGG